MLQVEKLSKSFGGVAAMQNVTLDFAPGSLTAVIGPNGAGKTTFFNLISGAIRPDCGRVKLVGEDIVGLSPSADRATRHGARVPGRQYFSVADGGDGSDRDRAGAYAATSEHIMRRFPLPRMPRSRLRSDEDAWPVRQSGGAFIEPFAWRSEAARHRAGARAASHACCCWTSRRRAWDLRNAGR